MYINSIMVMLGAADTPAATQPNPTGQMVQTIGLFVIMGAMFYFAMIRPQSKRAKEHATMLKSVKQNDQVTTSGGIVGVVVTVKENTLVIRSTDTKIEVLKSAVSAVDRSKNSTES
ncbi:preprotein translocase subunit YajC [Pedosphaera parvula]|uniref:Sec translocon accessory complex subunit YajC n=1 Tax=Pedosphaera parvula (strain Ellin514) TaxID=320771 RepID=B9XN53_PEDPL|nr:preprotein translocase subunit YajC [Pedosphaera parvula]EEF58715.1 preprotein translocase, YajC subunit [Pedosphaera parvula Ellin514]